MTDHDERNAAQVNVLRNELTDEQPANVRPCRCRDGGRAALINCPDCRGEGVVRG
ncbi:hypothetical protein [Deinococcus hohokamensis]|uniref:Molecular chaperone DnaJ n=1 Tax=Deinococcus hohokamensis TaxID=309883 RepID=A0ABV9I3P8_9DEIO